MWVECKSSATPLSVLMYWVSQLLLVRKTFNTTLLILMLANLKIAVQSGLTKTVIWTSHVKVQLIYYVFKQNIFFILVKTLVLKAKCVSFLGMQPIHPMSLCKTGTSIPFSPFCVFSRSLNTQPHPISFACSMEVIGRRLYCCLKPSKTHPKIFKMLHLHVVTAHIYHAMETLSLWAKIQRSWLSEHSGTAPWTQRVYALKTTKIIIFSQCGECASNHR